MMEPEHDKFGFRSDLKPRMPMKNRDKWSIMRRFLRALIDENKKKTRTRIMYECMFSNDQMKEYTKFLEDTGCVESKLLDTKYGSRGTYIITEKGMQILGLLDRMAESLPFIDETRKVI